MKFFRSGLPTRRIIEPLASRCSKFRFTPLDQSSSYSRLSKIGTAEHIDMDDALVDALIQNSNGDLRRAITYLQTAHRLSSATTPPTKITPRDIQEIAGVVPDNVVEDFVRTLGIEVLGGMEVDDQPPEAPHFDTIKKKAKEICREGYSATQVLSQVSLHIASIPPHSPFVFKVHDLVVAHPTLQARQKSACALIFAEADKALCDGADEELWILEIALRVKKAVAA